MTRRVFLLILLAAACARRAPTSPAAAGAGDLAVTYIANEGVLVEADGKRVLIDGLHRPSHLPYAWLPDGPRDALERAVPPWHDLDLILVSHLHRDHFHAEAVGTHLASAPRAELVTSDEVSGEIARGFAAWDTIRSRVRALPWHVGRIEQVTAAGVRVTFLGLSHGDGRMATVQNYGHLVEIGAWKVLHVGDAVPSAANFESLGLAGRGIDVAFLPWWHVASDESFAVVQRFIAPRKIVLVHVAPSEESDVLEHIRARAPEAVLFRRMLEDRLTVSHSLPRR